MVISREQIGKQLKEEFGLSSQAETERIMKRYEEIIMAHVKNGETVNLHNFIKLSLGERKERDGRNPQTGAKIKIPARKNVKVKILKGFNDLI